MRKTQRISSPSLARERLIMRRLRATAYMAACLAVALADIQSAAAATITWSGATNNTWSTTTNWNGGVTPGATSGTTNTDIALFNTNPTNKSPTWTTYLNLAGFTFDAGAGAYTIGTTSGSAAFLTSGGTTSILTGVTAAQIINAPLVILNASGSNSGSYTFLNSSTASAATLTLGGAISGQATAGNTTAVTFNSTQAGTISGVISNGTAGGSLSLTKSGAGTLTLSGNNTYSGVTTLNGAYAIWNDPNGSGVVTNQTWGNFGTLRVSGSLANTSGIAISGGGTFINGNSTDTSNNGVTNRINSAATLTMGGTAGGGTFTMAAPAASNTHSQSLASLAIGPGYNLINASAATGTTNLTFTGAAGSVYTRSTGGVVNFVPGTGVFNMSFTNTPSINMSGTGSDAILVGAFLSGTNFVRLNSGTLTAATYTANDATSLTAGANIDTGTSTSGLTGVNSINSIRFNDTVQRTVSLTSGTLVIASGGIITGTGAPKAASGGGATLNSGISGGALTSGTNELFFSTQSVGDGRYNFGINVASRIVDNAAGSVGLNITGANSVLLSNTANSFTGNIYMNSGWLALSGNTATRSAVTDGVLGGTNTIYATNGRNNIIADLGSNPWTDKHSISIAPGAMLDISGMVSTVTINASVTGSGVLSFGQTTYNNGVGFIIPVDQSGFTGTYQVGTSLRANEGVGLSSNANLLLAQNSTGGAGVLETSANMTRSLGSGPGQVRFGQSQQNSYGGGFSAVGTSGANPITVSLGGVDSPQTLTWGVGGFMNAGNGGGNTSGLVLQNASANNTLTWANPINNNGYLVAVIQNASTSGTATAATMTGVISGAGGFEKWGAGLLVLSATNTYTGKTSIRNGSLSVSSLNSVSGGSASSGLGAPTTIANGTIDMGLDNPATLLYTGTSETTDRVINLAGTTRAVTLDQSGSGLLKFTSALTATGSGAKTLTLQGSTAGTGEIAGAIVDYSGAGGPLATALTKAGTGTWTLSGTNTYTGVTTVNGGVLSVSTLANGGVASGIGASTNAAGNLVLGGGSLQYTGATVTTDRAFSLTASTTSTIDVSTAATTLTFTGSTAATTGALTKAGAGTLALGGTAAYTGATAINAGILQIGNGATAGAISGSSAISIASGATLAFSRTDAYSGAFANTISGSGALTVLSGSLTFSTANTYTGQTTVAGGVLIGGTTNAFGSSAPLAVNSGTVNLGGFAQTVGALSGSAGTLITTSTGAGSATLTTSFASGTSTFAGSIANNVSGTVAFTKSGAGTQVLSGLNSYSGTTSINAGRLALSGAGTLGASTAPLTLGGGQLDLGGLSVTVGNASGIAAFASGDTIQNGTLTGTAFSFSNTTGTATISAALAGAAANFTKSGAGTVTLTGPNAYTGTTTVNGGVLSVSTLANGGVASGIGASTNAAGNLVLGGGSLQYTGATVTTDRAFSLTASTTSTIDVSTAATTLTFTGSTAATTGALTKAGAGTLAIAGALANTGVTTINAGTLQIGNGGATGNLGSGNVSVASGATLAFSRTDAYGGNFGNAISGSGGLTVLSGSLTFSTANTYTGQTTVAGGVLIGGTTNAFGSSAPLAVNSGTVNLGGFAQTVGALSGSAGTLITTSTGAGSATLTTSFASGTSTFAGSIANNVSGTVAFTKAGAGTQILSGSNSYTGATTLSAGVLQLGAGSPNAVPAASTLTVNGGVFDLNGNNFTTNGWAGGNAAGTITDNSAVSGTTTLTLNNQNGTTAAALAPVITDGANGRVVAVNVRYTSRATFNLNAASTFSGGLTLGGSSALALQGRINLTTSGSGTPDNIISSALGRGTLTIGESTADYAQLYIAANDLTVLNPIVFNSTNGTDVVGGVRLGVANTVFAGTLTANLADISFGGGSISLPATITGRLTGSNGLWVRGGAIILSNSTNPANDYQGNTTIVAGQLLTLGAANQIPSGVGKGGMALSGTFNLGGYSTALNSLTGGGVLEAGGGTPELTIGATGVSGTFAGTLQNATGTLALTKSGTGTFTLSKANTYTGQTTVNGGVLAAGIANAFGSSAPLAVNSGTVNLAGFSQAIGALSGSAGTQITTGASGTATLTTAFASGTSTFAGSIANNGSGLVAFTQSGAGTQIFAGNNTYTGTTTVNAGTLQIGNGSTTGALSASSVITGSTGATLAFKRTDDYGGNFANTIGGGLGLTLSSGSLTLSATNTYTGDTAINAGRLEVASTGRLGSAGTYSGNLSNNGAFIYSGTNNQTISGLTTGSGSFTNNAASTLTFSGMSLSGSANAISSVAGGSINTGNLSTAAGSVLTLTVPGGANGGGIYLTGASNSVGGEVIVTGGSGNSGALVWSNVSGVNGLNGATKITVASGNTLRYGSASIGAGTALDLNGTGNGFRGVLSFYDSGTSTISGPVNLSGNSTIVSRNAALTLGGNITESGGARALTIGADNGGSTTPVYTLSGSNSFSGGLTFNAIDAASASTKLVAGSATAFGSGPLALNSLAQATASAIVDLNGQAITIGGLSGGNAANANSFIQSDAGAAVLTVNQATNGTFSGVIRSGSGSVALTKSGNATLTLAGANTFTGNTRIGAGTVAITNASGLLNSTLDLNAADAGTVSFSQNSTLGGLTGSRDLNLGGRTISIGNNNASTTYSGILSNGALTKIGAGTLTLTGSNTYFGGTWINGGTLTAGHASAFGTGAITLGSGATLDLNNVLVTNSITNNGGTIRGGTITGTVSGTSNVSGGQTTFDSTIAGGARINVAATGTASFGNGAVIQSGATFGNDGLLRVNRSVNSGVLAFGGAVSGSGRFQLDGGVARFDSANTYSGNTVITGSGSVLKLGAAGSFADSPVIVVGDATSTNAILDLTAKSGTFAIGNGQTLKGGGTIQLAANGVLDVQGTFTPGNSPGLFTYDGGTTLLSGQTIMEIFGENRASLASHGTDPYYDAVNVINGGTLTFGGLLTLDVTGSYADNTIFNLFSAGTGSSLTGNFSSIVFAPSGLYSSLTFTSGSANPKIWTSTATTAGQSFTFDAAVGTLVIVPEPDTVIFAGIGIAMAGWSIWKRRRVARMLRK